MIDTVTDKPQKHFKHQKLGIETVLQILAIILTISIFLKAIIDLDINYDPWWYHLPFAARIWGIVPPEVFLGDEKWFEPRFAGFPLLAHFLQGFFWKITGRIQATNLVNFLSIVIYFFFLRTYFQVPAYLSAIAFFAIPLVLTHATTSFVDLPGNIGTSILVMMTYRFYQQQQLPNKRELFIIFLGSAIAANTKTQLQPLVFVILLAIALRLIYLYFQQPSQPKKQLFKILPIALLASVLIFASPVKNTVLYGNPMYPIKLQIGGVVLNHKLSPEAFDEGNRQQNWFKSVLEINTPFIWTPDQWSTDINRNRRGGFFGAYVIFNILLLVGLFLQELLQNKSLPKSDRSKTAQLALITAILMSLVPMNFPQSHELRYFMFWMISLVSLNLSLVSRPRNSNQWRWLQPKYIGLVYALFLMIVLSKIGGLYAKPMFYNLETQILRGVKPEFLSQIQPDDQVCLISKHIGEDARTAPIAALKYAFLYSSHFHPELNYNYSIKAAFDPASCGNLHQIPEKLLTQ